LSQLSNRRISFRRGLGLAAATVALAAVPVFGTASIAAAADAGSGASGPRPGARPQLTDTQKQCLSDALSASGVTLPEKPTDGTRPQLTQEQRGAMKDAMKAAAEKCGLPARGPNGAGQPGPAGPAGANV
jgi:hypothetical protein